ncbi:MAG: hypothetical protein IIZ39_05280 [Blautia sp.]|nr:hypothetical protein [Blautia sp.]
MFIRVQNLKRNDDGVVVSGSASVTESIYDAGVKGGHCRQKNVLSLGKVIWISEDKSSGIFDCKDRGIVEYHLSTNSFNEVALDDERLVGSSRPLQERIHTTFGDAYIFFSLVDRSRVFDSIREAFSDESKLERVMIHVMYGCIRNHSGAKCGQFLERSMVSYLFHRYSASTLNCDSGYFEYMGDDNVKRRYFQTLIANMRKDYPGFGRSCYVDSTPLPNESQGFPYTALCSHGTDGLVMQARLALVLDIETGIPVWFQVFCSNVLDHSNLKDIQDDVRNTLNIDIDVAALDAGYAGRDLFEKYNIDNNTYVDPEGVEHERYAIVRMPQKNGFPHDELYLECKPRLYSALYLFDYNGHAYYGERFERKIFGFREYCYVFLDRKQAEDLGGKWRADNPQEWDALCDADKEWYAVKDGFFILISGKMQTPREALIEYKSRGKIEGFFKDGKSYTDIMPLNSWTKPTILGKILHDVIQTTVYRLFRKELGPINTSVGYFLTEIQSLDCMKEECEGNRCKVFTPKKQVREYYQALGYTVPAFMDLEPLRKEIMCGEPMDRTPVTVAKKRSGKSADVKHCSPEEKERKRNYAKAVKEAEKVYEKALNRAEKAYGKALNKAKAEMEKLIAKAAAKRDTSLQGNLSEEEGNAAKYAYELAVEDAKRHYENLTTEALKKREAQTVEAKASYDAAIAECNEKYGRS